MLTWCRQFLKFLASTTQFAWWGDNNNQVKRTRVKNIHYTGGRWKIWELWQGNTDLEWNDWRTPEPKGWLHIYVIEQGQQMRLENIEMMQLKTNKTFFAGWPSSGWHHHHIWKRAGFIELFNIIIIGLFHTQCMFCQHLMMFWSPGRWLHDAFYEPRCDHTLQETN